jgi:hypothetical protein
MKVSKRLNGIRAVLGFGLFLALLYGISYLLFPKFMTPAGETFTNPLEVVSREMGALALTWAVAAGIALRDILRNPGLVLAIAITLGVLGVVMLYNHTFVAETTILADWVTIALLLILFIALLVLYPWRRPQGQH